MYKPGNQGSATIDNNNYYYSSYEIEIFLTGREPLVRSVRRVSEPAIFFLDRKWPRDRRVWLLDAFVLV